MKNILLILFIASYCCNVLGQDQYSHTGFDAPVSITQYGGFYYLSNSGMNFGLPVEDGDGYISRIKSDGSQDEPTQRYITGLNNPRGIYAINGTLYVCDINRLVGFDLISRKKVFEVSFAKEKVTQLTCIVSANDKTVYLSATDINTIFEVDLSTKKYKKWIETPSPAGLLINKNQMYVCSMGTDSLPNGKLGVIDMKSKKYSRLSDDEGYFYGMALNGKRLYYSDWVEFAKRGVIKWIDIDKKTAGQVKFTSKIGGPADFVYDERNDIFLIPAVLENRVFGCIGFLK
jgi:DNA-binding beta-propeller fold protein YncE